ncbi:MAG: hypothetical protein K2X81_28490 [Candidatus Obscuribacterales bacterium]|nr:hypothetical protein [Candidatus Obscuribacterales bacterium]
MRLFKTAVLVFLCTALSYLPACLAAPDVSPEPAGTVRVNNLANLEALLNIIANSCEIVGIACGMKILPCGIALLFLQERRVLGVLLTIGGLGLGVVAIAMPGVVSWFIQSARDASL